MKPIMENWKKFLVEGTVGKQLSEYVGKHSPGMVRLFHFTSGRHAEGDSVVIDPGRFAKGHRSYSKQEFNRSGYPRSFYYTDLSHIEDSLMAGNELFFVDVPAESIYDFKNDEYLTDYYMKHKRYSFVDWDALFKDVSQSFGGMYYTLGKTGPPVVIYFKPLKVEKMEQ